VPSLPDAGSSLRAQNVVFQAANDANEPVAVANKGGVFFCGGTRTATKDNVSSQNLRQQSISWSFVAESITANYLGRTDPRGGDGDGNTRDDVDAVSVVGAVFLEWRVRTVTVNHSGDDGFDLTNASIAMESVRVFAPVEDGLNLSTSLLQLSGRLEIDMINSTARDREIFDFEVDAGPVQIWIAPGATVDIRGYWGNSPGDLRIDVKSSDMPRPSLLAREWYAFKGPLVSKPARIRPLADVRAPHGRPQRRRPERGLRLDHRSQRIRRLRAAGQRPGDLSPAPVWRGNAGLAEPPERHRRRVRLAGTTDSDCSLDVFTNHVDSGTNLLVSRFWQDPMKAAGFVQPDFFNGSVDPFFDGAPPTEFWDSQNHSVSNDGRTIAFTSSAGNLVQGWTNVTADLAPVSIIGGSGGLNWTTYQANPFDIYGCQFASADPTVSTGKAALVNAPDGLANTNRIANFGGMSADGSTFLFDTAANNFYQPGFTAPYLCTQNPPQVPLPLNFILGGFSNLWVRKINRAAAATGTTALVSGGFSANASGNKATLGSPTPAGARDRFTSYVDGTRASDMQTRFRAEDVAPGPTSHVYRIDYPAVSQAASATNPAIFTVSGEGVNTRPVREFRDPGVDVISSVRTAPGQLRGFTSGNKRGVFVG